MARSGVTWIRPPAKLAAAIKANEGKFLAAVYALAMNTGGIMMGEAREGAPWTDRTGNARSGLYMAVEGFGRAMTKKGGRIRNVTTGKYQSMSVEGTLSVKDDELVIVLGHTMYYGVYLELSNGERYAIVWPTIQKNAPTFMAALKEMCR
jgi:hypothetical protein